MEVFANAEGEAHFRRAIRILDEYGSQEGDEENLIRAQAFEMIGDLAERSGRHDEARTVYAQAEDHLSAEDRLSRCRLLRKTAKCWEEQRLYEDSLRVLSMAEEALGAPRVERGPDWEQEWFNVKVGRLWIYYWLGDAPAMEALLEEIRPISEAMGRPEQKARMLICQVLIDYRRFRYRLPQSTVELAEEVLAATEASGARLLIAEGVFTRGFARLFHGDFSGARESLAEAVRLANRAGDVVKESRAAIYHAVACRRLGAVDEVEEITHRTVPLHEAAEQAQYVGACLANLSWVAWRRGDRSMARALVTEAKAAWADMALDYPVRWIGLIQLLAMDLEVGDLPAAIESAKRLLHPLQVRQADDVEGALSRAVEFFGGRDSDRARAALADAVAAAEGDTLL